MPEITVKAEVGKLPEIQEFVRSVFDQTEVSKQCWMEVEISVEEIFVNIASYAYGAEGGMATVRCEVTREDPARFMIQFEDAGKAFNPLEKEEADITLPAKERPIGGLGIFMVRKYMNDVTYERKEGHNILSIFKNV